MKDRKISANLNSYSGNVGFQFFGFLAPLFTFFLLKSWLLLGQDQEDFQAGLTVC